MKLSGFELRNFRSIGKELVVLRPWRKCNILIGQNNSGKSNVIRAVRMISDKLRHKPSLSLDDLSLDDLDLFRLQPKRHFYFELYFEVDASEAEELVRLSDTTLISFRWRWDRSSDSPLIVDNSLAHITNYNFEDANRFRSAVKGVGWRGGVPDEECRKEFRKLSPEIFNRYCADSVPVVHIIPEFRQIQPGNEYTFGGTNLIGRLSEYQHPGTGQDHLREKFDRIQEFVQRLLHLPEAILEVAHDKTKIMLTSNDLRLPLESYGTGVHELVIMLTAILSVDDAIFCIEEPEIHLHPSLQREFVEFITTETTNQYLISTHSPTLINAHSTMPVNTQEAIQVFHLWLEGGATVGEPVLADIQSLQVLNDLGVKASDILQSNCVIWVEGPSDRVYLKRWLELVAPDLIEGLHFSIMFYGGRLLSHLSTGRDDVPEELIDVLKINQNAIIMMDSDRDRPRTRLSGTKLRIRKECERSESICWVTDGREVENYLPERVIAAACKELVEKEIAFSINQYDKFGEILSRALRESKARNIDYSSDKVRYARVFANHFKETDFSPELKNQVDKVANRIREWNEYHSIKENVGLTMNLTDEEDM